MILRVLIILFLGATFLACSGTRDTSAFRTGKKKHKNSATIHLTKRQAKKKEKAGRKMNKAAMKRRQGQ